MFGTEQCGAIIFRAMIQLADLRVEQDRRASTNKVFMFTYDRALSAHLKSMQPSASPRRPQKETSMGMHTGVSIGSSGTRNPYFSRHSKSGTRSQNRA
jgi:hypothetical protein